MSKKGELVVMPVSGDQIDSSIDMKLTKQDLIDMVIEETRDVLEVRVDNAQHDYNEMVDLVEKSKKKLPELFKAAVKAKYKKELKLIAAHGGERHTYHDVSENIYVTDKGLKTYNDMREVRHMNNRDRSSKILLEDGTEIISNFQVPSHFKIENAETKKGDEAMVNIRINITFQLPEDELVKLYGPFTDIVKGLAASKVALADLKTQLAGVDKMGKKAKTQLIKRMLESSGNGQAILSNMGAIKTNVAQLLLESTKKAE
jgi:hypothetical protein